MGRQKSPQQLSKFIAYVLGRRPDEFGLVPDAAGFVKIKEFLKAICEEEEWRYVRRAHLNEVLLTLPDPPIEIDANRIRATTRERLPRHALVEDLPKLLYTCVRRKAYPFVHEKGIFPSGYSHVILSSSRNLAERMGKRGDHLPVLLTVLVEKSLAKGISFYQAGRDLYLADAVYPDCFTGPPLPKEKPEPKKRETVEEARSPKLAGSFLLSPKSDKDEKNQRKRKKERKTKRERPPWRS